MGETEPQKHKYTSRQLIYTTFDYLDFKMSFFLNDFSSFLVILSPFEPF